MTNERTKSIPVFGPDELITKRKASGGLTVSVSYPGILDAKGRTCGGCMVINAREGGTAYAYILALRDGKLYGPAWTNGKTYPSVADAEAAAPAALAAQRKRYARKFPQTAGGGLNAMEDAVRDMAPAECPVCADGACETKSEECGK